MLFALAWLTVKSRKASEEVPVGSIEDLGLEGREETLDNAFTLLPRVDWGEPVKPDGEFILPVGTVTLLLADVEGSTRRWEEDHAGMATASSELRDLADELIGRHNGVRPLDQGEGDSFLGAFARPSEAVACALDIQRKAPLPLRIGIHAGEVHRTEEGNYIGPALNRTARVRDAGHGGQILLSQAAAELVADRLHDASLRDHGTHRLKDLSRPERIFQLMHPDLRSDFPPLRSLDLYRHNLPIHATRFIGRQSEMQEIEDLLSGSSMVTLSGTGGSGKTRLALQIAAKLVDGFPDGVYLCDLARVSDPQGVPAAVATAVGFGVEAGSALISLLSEKQLLLILDNCEHVISSSAELCQSFLAGAPKVRILATSREPLKVEGETNFVVPSLPVPSVDATGGIEGLAPYAASELFLDRARRARSDFQLADQDTSAVAAICRRLDGIPLAIELAAARVRVMSPKEIAQGLDERFGLLTGGARTAVPRHQTLAASVDWSHDLLTDLERAVLRRLSVFIGGFTLEAAKEVCSGPKSPSVAPHQAVDLLSLLVEKSLVNVSMTGGQSRYSLLETIRQYAAAKLAAAGEEEDVRKAHRDHFLESAAGLSKRAEGPEGDQAFAAFVGDRENFEAAFRWSCASGHFEEAATFLSASAGLLLSIWVGEALGWATAVMPSIERVPEPARTDALYRCAPFLTKLGSQTHLEPMLKECIAFHRKSGDELRLCRALLAWVQLTSTKDEMTNVLEEAVEITERLNDIHATITAKAHSVFQMGIEDQDRKDRYLDDLVRELNEADAPVVRFSAGAGILNKLLWEDIVRSIAFSEPLAARDLEQVSSPERHSLTDQPMALVFAGRYAEAEALAEKLIRGRKDVGDLGCLMILHLTMAFSAEARNDSDSALAHFQRSSDAWSKTPFSPDLMEVAGGIFRLGAGDVDEGVRVRDKFTPEALASGFLWGPMFWAVLSGGTRYLQGEIEQAEEQAHKNIAEGGANWLLLDSSFDLLAAIAVRDNSYVEATRLLAGAAAHRDRIGLKWGLRVFRDIRSDTIEKIKEALPPEEFEQAWLQGSAMTIQQTVGYAQRGRGERKRPPTGWRSLTPTERQVVDLLAEGRSNKEVAGKMFVSVRTITTHLTHIYLKLGVTSRTELVAEAMRRPGIL